MSEPIHVHHLVKSLGRGGAERLLVEMLPHASPRFVHSFSYFLPWKDAFVEELRAQGAAVHCHGARSSLDCLLRTPLVAAHLRRQRVNLLHCHLPVASIVGRLAGRTLGLPVVSSEHNLLERYHPMTRRLSLATWSLQSQVIAVSGEVARSIEKAGATRVPVTVVRNGVSAARFAPTMQRRASARREFGIAEDAVVVGTVCVFRTQKRLDHWLEAARALASRQENVRFLLVGDGPLRADVEALVERFGLGSKVLRPGLRDDVERCLAAMDVFFSSSEFEGLPVALLEAMAAELPIVSTRVGGVPEVVREDVEGRLLEVGDVPGARAALETLTRDEGLRRRMGRAARTRVDAAFGLRPMVDALESVYDAARERR